MMDTTSNDERTSTASSISGVYRNILKSPAPICMFYFKHPFGVSTPAVRKSTSNQQHTNNDDQSSSSGGDGATKISKIQKTTMTLPSLTQKSQSTIKNSNIMRQIIQEKCEQTAPIGGANDGRLASYVPWPRDTWQRDYVLPPIIELIAKQKGQRLPDLESILSSIQQAWNTPYNRSLLNSGVTHEESSSSSSNWDLTQLDKLIDEHSYSVSIMGSGTYGTNSNVGTAGSGLMRRRYSVPEIIMRKHSLSQQKSYDESTTTHTNVSTTTITTPPIRSPEITSGSDSNLSRGISGGGGGGGGGNSGVSGISAGTSNYYYGSSSGGYGFSGGANNNEFISMRKTTLLRRIWSKELQRHNIRSGSWSPPLRRAPHHQRKLVQQLSGQCLECKKLNDEYHQQQEQATCSPKRLRLATTTTAAASSTTTTGTISSAVSSSITSIIENSLKQSEENSDGARESSTSPSYTVTSVGSAINIQRGDDSSQNKNTSDTDDYSELKKDTNHNIIERPKSNSSSTGSAKNVKIYMTAASSVTGGSNDSNNNIHSDSNNITCTSGTQQPVEEAQDILHVEIEDRYGDDEGELAAQQNSVHGVVPTSSTEDQFISNLLIENLNQILQQNNLIGDSNNKDINFNEQLKNEHKSSSTEDNCSSHIIMNINDSSLNNNNNNNNNNSNCDKLNLNLTNIYIKSELINDYVVRKQHFKENKYNNTVSHLLYNSTNSDDLNDKNLKVYSAEIENYDGNQESARIIGVNDEFVCTENNPNNQICFDFKSREETIYFPRYSAESRGDLSSHTSIASEPDAQEIVKIGTGSVYPFNGVHLVIIPRLSAIPRTESMEVQGSGIEDNSDSSISLVDSLDDPLSPSAPNNNSKNTKNKSIEAAEPGNNNTTSPTHRIASGKEVSHQNDETKSRDSHSGKTKSEAFFVPITDEYDIMDEQLVVAESMPERLREKLQRRQLELDTKHKHIEGHVDLDKHFNAKSSIIILDDLPDTNDGANVIHTQKLSNKKMKNGSLNKNVLRQHLDMLESYTIDGKGNMQFTDGSNKNVKTDSAIKIIATTSDTTSKKVKILGATKKLKSNGMKNVDKNLKSSKTIGEGGSRSSKHKNMQKLTLYQNTGDMITPDKEGGPRRMYQKTEIQNNGKSIEILEIVECESSSNNYRSPLRPINNRNQFSSSSSATLSSSSTTKLKSKIPLPTSGRSIRIINSSLHSASNSGSKVDRAIASLLMDAINNPEQSSIELVKSPKSLSHHTSSSSNGGKSKSKHSSGGGSTGGGQSNQTTRNGVGRNYKQKFEVIPEEKSSLSHDTSSNDELNRKMKRKTQERFIVISSSDDSNMISHYNNKNSNGSSIGSNTTGTIKILSNNNFNSNNNHITTTTSSTTTRPTEKIKTKESYSAFDVINHNMDSGKISPSTSITSSILSAVDNQSNLSVASSFMPKGGTSNGHHIGGGKQNYRGGRNTLADDEVNSKAWIGFFKRHEGSDIESLNEDDLQTPISAVTNETIHAIPLTSTTIKPIIDHKKSKSKKTVSINGSSRTMSPAIKQIDNLNSNIIVYPPPSTTSDSVISVIDRTFVKDESNKNKIDDETQSIDSTYLKECINKDNCVQCKVENSDKNHHEHRSNNTSSQHNGKVIKGCDCIEKGYLQKQNSETGVWQVCGSNDCKLIQLKLDTIETKIDTNSFVIYGASDKSGDETSTARSPKKSSSQPSSAIPVKSPDKKKKLIQLHSKSSFDENQIVCHDLTHDTNDHENIENHGGKHERENGKGSNGKSTSKNGGKPTSDDCYFCNPEVNFDTNKVCDYCKVTKQQHLKYEILTKTDHKHKKTKIRENDVTSTKCAKTNQKIKRAYLPSPYLPEPSKLSPSSVSNYNDKSPLYSPKSNISSISSSTAEKFTPKSPKLNRPKHYDSNGNNHHSGNNGNITNNNSPKTATSDGGSQRSLTTATTATATSQSKSMQKVQKIIHDEVKVSNAFKKTTKKSKMKNLRLPSPYATTTEQSSNHDDDEYDDEDEDHDGELSLNSDYKDSASKLKSNNYFIVERAANNWRSNAHKKMLNSRWVTRNNTMNQESTNENAMSNGNNNNFSPVGNAISSSHTPIRPKGKWGPKLTSNAPGNNSNQGWSVTVAGNYNPDMAPDVEMRLSFPNHQQQVTHQQTSTLNNNSLHHLSQQKIYHQNTINHYDIHDYDRDEENENQEDANFYGGRGGKYDREEIQMITDGHHHPHQDSRSQTSGRNTNLTSINPNSNNNYICNNRNHHLPSAGILPPATASTIMSNGMFNDIPKRSLMKLNDRRNQSGYYHLPDVNNGHHRINHLINKQTSKKAIKQKVECSVAVTASASRTISNISNNSKRSMSYQSLSIPETGRYTNRKRDHSIDMGTMSSRRMSYDSQPPFSGESTNLSVMGNAIAPEQKPKVPTMSEKDLTRRHSSCFTRNRPFLS